MKPKINIRSMLKNRELTKLKAYNLKRAETVSSVCEQQNGVFIINTSVQTLDLKIITSI